MGIKAKIGLSGLASAVALGMSMNASAVPVAADVVFIVDESGSMSGEHAWLKNMIADLEAGLKARGVGVSESNNYALVGFGASSSGHGSSQRGHAHDMQAAAGQQDWGSSTDFSTATNSLVTSGGTEDGWEAISWAANNLSFRSGKAVNFVLVTDEDRDSNPAPGQTLTKESTYQAMKRVGAMLNAVVSNPFGCSDTAGTTIGVNSVQTGYQADGSGGYSACVGQGVVGNGAGNTETAYVDLAHQTGGAGWNLNVLRSGGNNATSFTKAFVDIKVEEIITQVPEPATLALMGLGLAGLGAARRKQSK